MPSVRSLVAAAGLAAAAVPLVLPSAPAHAAAHDDLVISELRWWGAGGPFDEFVEIANIGFGPHVVDGEGAGYAIVASDGAVRCVIPDGTVIPAGGHFLCAHTAFELEPYGTPDATYTLGLDENVGVALFDSTNPSSFTLAHRIDAFGTDGEANPLYREGAGVPAIPGLPLEYSWARDVGQVGQPLDTDDNAADFRFVDPSGTLTPGGQRLGAPSPQSLTSPVPVDVLVRPIDECAHPWEAPNVVHDPTPVLNGAHGTLDLRRTITNTTGAPLTRLRLRIADVTTFPSPSGIADLRVLSSDAAAVTVDGAPCGSGSADRPMAATQLEEPPVQQFGGGVGSSLVVPAVGPATPLAPGASIDVRVRLGVEQLGAAAVLLVVEATAAGGADVGVGQAPVTCLMGTADFDDPCFDVEANPDWFSGTGPIHVPAPGVLANDRNPRGAFLVVELVGQPPEHGTVALGDDGSFTYTPDPGFVGTDSFWYGIADGRSVQNAEVTIHVEAPAEPAAPEAPDAPAAECPEDGFVDVPDTNVHEPAIDCAVALGLAQGTSPTTYDPAGTVSRGQAATFVVGWLEAAGVDVPTGVPDAFGDDDGSTHEASIDRLAALGVVTGDAAGAYRPSDPMTRAQVTALLVRAFDAAGAPLPGGPDAFDDDDGSVHEPSIDAAAAAGVVTGTGPRRFRPDHLVRRDQLASILTRALGVVIA